MLFWIGAFFDDFFFFIESEATWNSGKSFSEAYLDSLGVRCSSKPAERPDFAKITQLLGVIDDTSEVTDIFFAISKGPQRSKDKIDEIGQISQKGERDRNLLEQIKAKLQLASAQFFDRREAHILSNLKTEDCTSSTGTGLPY